MHNRNKFHILHIPNQLKHNLLKQSQLKQLRLNILINNNNL